MFCTYKISHGQYVLADVSILGFADPERFLIVSILFRKMNNSQGHLLSMSVTFDITGMNCNVQVDKKSFHQFLSFTYISPKGNNTHPHSYRIF